LFESGYPDRIGRLLVLGPGRPDQNAYARLFESGRAADQNA
jgi:hypothetical protein